MRSMQLLCEKVQPPALIELHTHRSETTMTR